MSDKPGEPRPTAEEVVKAVDRKIVESAVSGDRWGRGGHVMKNPKNPERS